MGDRIIYIWERDKEKSLGRQYAVSWVELGRADNAATLLILQSHKIHTV